MRKGRLLMHHPHKGPTIGAAVSDFFFGAKKMRTYYVVEDEDRFYVCYQSHSGEPRVVSESRSQQLAWQLCDKLNDPKQAPRPKQQYGNRYLRQFQEI